MAYIKLNVSIRERIAKTMVSRKFDPIREKLDKEKDKMADKLYNLFLHQNHQG